VNALTAIGFLLLAVGVVGSLFAGLLARLLTAPLDRRIERASVYARTRDTTIPDVPDEWPAGEVEEPTIIVSADVTERERSPIPRIEKR